MTKGIFVAVDGPKRSGKTSVLNIVTPMLSAVGLRVLYTKEPTAGFDLSQEESCSGIDLARRLAVDRESHLRETILPALAENDVVITDRYIASSLVFQVLDGVPFNQVWDLNQNFLLPDINIFFTVDASSSIRRLEARRLRGVTTRLELSTRADDEADRYRSAMAFLASKGVRVAEVPNDDAKTRDEDNERRGEAAVFIADLIKKACDQIA